MEYTTPTPTPPSLVTYASWLHAILREFVVERERERECVCVCLCLCVCVCVVWCVCVCAPVYMNVVHKNQYQLEIWGQILPCTAKDTCHWRSKVSEDGAHFLLRKPKLKMRKTIVMMIPQVARTPSITVTAMCTVTVSSSGTPS